MSDNKDINEVLEPPQEIAPMQAIKALTEGEITLHGLMPWSSNYTFLGTICSDGLKFNIIYKPCQGERPLWDFEDNSLCRREVAAYEVSHALGNWPLIPPTVLRNGPHGPGAVQQYVHADYGIHYFVLKDNPQYSRQFQQLALFDYLVNNADRKGGHCLLDKDDRLWAIDHGLTFHTEYKLRTVIWDYAGQPIPSDLYATLETLKQGTTENCALCEKLLKLINQAELDQFLARLETLLSSKYFPQPQGQRDYPYPPI